MLLLRQLKWLVDPGFTPAPVEPVMAFEHQHVPEIKQSLKQLQNSFDADIDFIPYRGDFARGIFATIVVKTKVALDEIVRMYEEY